MRQAGDRRILVLFQRIVELDARDVRSLPSTRGPTAGGSDRPDRRRRSARSNRAGSPCDTSLRAFQGRHFLGRQGEKLGQLGRRANRMLPLPAPIFPEFAGHVFPVRVPSPRAGDCSAFATWDGAALRRLLAAYSEARLQRVPRRAREADAGGSSASVVRVPRVETASAEATAEPACCSFIVSGPVPPPLRNRSVNAKRSIADSAHCLHSRGTRRFATEPRPLRSSCRAAAIVQALYTIGRKKPQVVFARSNRTIARRT